MCGHCKNVGGRLLCLRLPVIVWLDHVTICHEDLLLDHRIALHVVPTSRESDGPWPHKCAVFQAELSR